jgi:hypothetical protein
MQNGSDGWVSVCERLDTLVRIQALVAVAHLQTKAEKISFLSDAGLSPKDIGPVVGSSAASVSQAIYTAKKKKNDGEKVAET